MKLIKSKKTFRLAQKIIPLASQTFSRSHYFFDKNYFPLYLNKGVGQYVYDLDGNKYLDYISALGSVSVGYGEKKINNIIKKNIDYGNCFSLSHPIEVEVAKKLVKLIPSAEMVRFGKNGTDVNSAAIRLARHYTKKDLIAVCGYHGWQDWYIASTSMNSGVPRDVQKQVKKFNFNDIESLEKILKSKKCAAVIMEPLSYNLPKNNFLKKVRNLCDKYKSILIFDEICSGFRVSIGGAQKIYNVKPDISTFGKAMANGFPLAAIVGKKKIMKHMDKIFYSGTFAGEISSLYACNATIDFMIKNRSISKNLKKGIFIKNAINKLIISNNLQNYISLEGHETWLFLTIKNNIKVKPELIKAYIRQELIKKRILFLGSFNITYSHNYNDLRKTITEIDKIFYFLNKNLHEIRKFVHIKLQKNIFEIRKSDKK
jgi:glutamate-1-semialdehyde 2,1-aminomutase